MKALNHIGVGIIATFGSALIAAILSPVISSIAVFGCLIYAFGSKFVLGSRRRQLGQP